MTSVLSVMRNALFFGLTPLIVQYAAISPEAKGLVIWLVLINNIFNGLACPYAGSLGNGLRAAGDVKFTRITSYHIDYCCAFVIFGIAWPCIELGSYRSNYW